MEMRKSDSPHRLVSFIFILYGFFFAGACVYEIGRAANNGIAELTAANSTIAMTVWMLPIVILSITCFIGFTIVRRYASGQAIAHANARALKFLALGVIFSGAIEGTLQAVMDNIIPEIVQYGDKDNFLNMAYMAIGGLLLIMAQVMKSASAMKEDYDHFL